MSASVPTVRQNLRHVHTCPVRSITSPPAQSHRAFGNAGPEDPRCVALIEAHKACLRSEGFKVRTPHW